MFYVDTSKDFKLTWAKSKRLGILKLFVEINYVLTYLSLES